MTDIVNVTIKADVGVFKQTQILDYIPNYDISSRDKNIVVRDEYARIFNMNVYNIVICREKK